GCDARAKRTADCCGWICQRVVTSGPGNAQAIEGNVPDQFFPMSAGKVVGDFANNSRVSKHGRDLVSARLGPALKFPKQNPSLAKMMNHAGRSPIQPDETETTENLFDWKQLRELLLVAQTILQCDDCRPRPDKRRQQ